MAASSFPLSVHATSLPQTSKPPAPIPSGFCDNPLRCLPPWNGNRPQPRPLNASAGSVRVLCPRLCLGSVKRLYHHALRLQLPVRLPVWKVDLGVGIVDEAELYLDDLAQLKIWLAFMAGETEGWNWRAWLGVWDARYFARWLVSYNNNIFFQLYACLHCAKPILE